MKRVAARLKRAGDFSQVRCAYLEINPPSISAAIGEAASRGAREIRVLPYFVLSGRHVNEHIPQTIRRARKKNPSVRIKLCAYLGYDKRIVDVVQDRIRRG